MPDDDTRSLPELLRELVAGDSVLFVKVVTPDGREHRLTADLVAVVEAAVAKNYACESAFPVCGSCNGCFLRAALDSLTSALRKVVPRG